YYTPQASKTPNGILHRNEKMAARPLARLWKVSDPTLFQMTLVAALLATVLGDCGPPPNLLFAFPMTTVVNQTHFNPGATVKYTCRPGYGRVSYKSSTLTCQDDTWNYSEFCTKKRCKNPGELQNGQVIAKPDHLFGSHLEFVCSEGYILIGPATSYCEIQDKGVDWSDPLPLCIIVRNGKIISGLRPTYNYQNNMVFECNEGYILKGSKLIYCGEDGEWNPPPPTCELNSCPELPNIPNAYWERQNSFLSKKQQMYSIGTTLSYRCHFGYEPASDGPTTLTCQKNLTWTPHIECKEICCPVPKLENGEIIRSRTSSRNNCTYFLGDTILYKCYKKYQPESRCQGDGTWNPKTPTCDESCDYPPFLPHGYHERVNGFNVFKKEEVIYKCYQGYTLVGEPRLSCSYSRWSPAVPQCKALCLKPEIAHATLSMDKDQYIQSENVTIQCDSKYKLVGPQSITCLESRTWYPEMSKCEWVVPEGCEHILKGRKTMQCLPNPEDVKMALEIYKLSLDIELLELQRDRAKESTKN
uniref:Sushi domain-containing protein n=1 Tax=Canis lupus familiaris TaxID=9615 RepID=A0A8I3S1U9_CANLF